MRLGRNLIIAAAVLALQACSSWRPVTLEAGAAPVLEANRPVRATRQDGSTVVLYEPRVVGDSLIGNAGNPPLRTAVAWRDIRDIDMLRVSVGRTAAAAGATVGAGVVVAGLAFLSVVALILGGR